MPDWKKVVRERLGPFALPQESEESIVAELSAHLEDDCQEGRRDGLSESEASARILSEIQWNRLARGIRSAMKEESVNNRTKTLWLPAIVNLMGAAVLLIILEKVGAHSRMIQDGHLVLARLAARHIGAAKELTVIDLIADIPLLLWLFALPLSAAAGSLMAKRAQAPTSIRLIVGLAPSLVWLCVFVAMALEFELDRWQFPSGLPLEPTYFALSAFVWVVLPAVPLLLGTLPFLRETELGKA
jgi:hypothetical protein